jgi:tetratricopeptide (TPR) repeat protein
MKHSRLFLSLCLAGLGLLTGVAQASEEDAFLGKIHPQSGQAMGQGRSALWTLPLVATEYRPSHPTTAMQDALLAQHEGHFLYALIQLDDAQKLAGRTEAGAQIDLLRASFLLQGRQSDDALQILAPLHRDAQYAADAYALSAMAYLQQGRMQQALDAANLAHQSGNGVLPSLAQSYALQGMGRLDRAKEVMHEFNRAMPQEAIALAREAELALTLAEVQSARSLVSRAQAADAAHPYVIAVNGLTCLIEGDEQQARAAFDAALQRDPKDARALLGQGLAEIRLGNFQQGLQKLQAANEAAPDDALILTYLGRSQQQSGNIDAAMASWRSAQLADPKDPVPWLYQAQAQLQANRLQDARESLREAQQRSNNRQVYRGASLLNEDQQLLQANLAEVQRRSGLDSLAFHTLSDPVGEKNSVSLRNQADLLLGQRFGESARRSLLLQSLFDDRPGNLPSTQDIFGDGTDQVGASAPQHGVIGVLSSQQTSYSNYDALFNQRTVLEADATTASRNTNDQQLRLGAGNDVLGIGLAQRKLRSDGFAPFETIDNRAGQAIVQWRPVLSTQMFLSQQNFNSNRGDIFYPADPAGFHAAIVDNSRVTRLGLRHHLTENSELRTLLSVQQSNSSVDYFGLSIPFIYQYSSYGSGSVHSEELQYRRSGERYSAQLGMQQTRGQFNINYSFPYAYGITQNSQQWYGAWQQTLNPHWQIDSGLALGTLDDTGNKTYLKRWLPRLGMVYTPDSATHVRLAAWQGMDARAPGDATLAPVSLAGVLLSRPGDNGKLVHALTLGGDRQLSPDWLLDAQTQRRRADLPGFLPPQQILFWQRVDESRLALHWQPLGRPWIASLSFEDERIKNDPTALITQDSVDEQRLRTQQLALRWFACEQCIVNLSWDHNQVASTQRLLDYTIPAPYIRILPNAQNSFDHLDADLSWQFKHALFTAGVRNALDSRFQYVEIDPLNPRFSKGRLLYVKLKLAW